MTKILKETVGDLVSSLPLQTKLARALASNPEMGAASLAFDFANQGYGRGTKYGLDEAIDLSKEITWTRATTKTGTDPDGTLRTYAVGEPAFDWADAVAKGISIHEARTNYIIHNRNFADASWNKLNTTIDTSGSVVRLDGTTPAAKLVESTASGEHYLEQTVSQNATGTYTQSIFVKNSGKKFVSLSVVAIGESTAVSRASINLETNSVNFINGIVSSAEIKPLTDGRVRISITYTIDVSVTSHRIRFSLNGDANETVYTGDGVSGVYVDLPQMESGSFATPPIETMATTATREADVAVIEDLQSKPWWNPNAGTFVVEFHSQNDNTVIRDFFTFSDNSAVNRVALRRILSNTQINLLVTGSTNVNFNVDLSQPFVFAFSFDVNKGIVSASVNGGAVQSLATSSSVELLTKLSYGASFSSSDVSNFTSKFAYILPYAVSDAQLQELSTL